MACDSPDVVNDFAAAANGDPHRGVVEWTVLLEPEEAGSFVLDGDLDPESELNVRACPEPMPLWGPWSRGGSPISPLLLGPAWYSITWKAPLDVGVTLDAVLEPTCSFEAQDCPAGQHAPSGTSAKRRTSNRPSSAKHAARARAVSEAAASPNATPRCPVPTERDVPASAFVDPCDAAQAGRGQCVPAGDTKQLHACDLRDGA